MAKLKGELQADNGDLLYPHTSSDVVFGPDGKSVQEQIGDLSTNKADKINTVRTNANNTHLYKTTLEWGINNKNVVSTYAGNGYTDLPPGFASGWWGDIWSIGGDSTTVYLKGNNSSITYHRVLREGKWITDWKEQATTEKIDISSLCVNGWKVGEYRHGFVSKVGNSVIANLSVSSGVKNYGTVIFQLPSGYRPSTTIDIQAHCYEKSTGNWQYAILYIETNGNVCVSNVPINDSVVFTLSFAVA